MNEMNRIVRVPRQMRFATLTASYETDRPGIRAQNLLCGLRPPAVERALAKAFSEQERNSTLSLAYMSRRRINRG